MLRRSRIPLLGLLVLALAGAAVGIWLGTGSGGGGGLPVTVTTQTQSSASYASAFRPGVCGGGHCSPGAIRRYNLNVPDSDADGCGLARCGRPASTAPSIFIERPDGLSSRPAPLLVAFSGSVAGDLNWLAASAADGFVYVSVPTNHHCSGGSGCEYAASTSAADLIGVGDSGPRPLFQDCGTSGDLTCDDIPWVQHVITALESCTSTTARAGGAIGDWVAVGDPVPAYGASAAGAGNGAPPCEHIDPHEVFVEGGSRGGGMTLDAVCDTRTSALIAGASVISEVMVSPAATSRTLPNCPALLPLDRSTCVTDCVPAAPNRKLSLQFIWGDEDPNYPPDTSYCDRTVAANDCAGVGWKARLRWVFGNIKLARDVFGRRVLGCSATPSATTTTGTAGRITVTTYSDGCRVPGVATQTVRVGAAGHMPDTWPYRTTSGIVCIAGCVDYDGKVADGLIEPLAAWRFWTRYFR